MYKPNNFFNLFTGPYVQSSKRCVVRFISKPILYELCVRNKRVRSTLLNKIINCFEPFIRPTEHGGYYQLLCDFMLII